MTSLTHTTWSAKPHEVERKWLLIDAAGKTLGRLATEIATRLRGKHKTSYTPHVDTGDYVIVLNAAQVRLTGNKMKKELYWHTLYPGGIKSITIEKLLIKAPEEVIEHAVKGMLPRGPLGRDMYRKMRVYAGSEHPHAAQEPELIEI